MSHNTIHKFPLFLGSVPCGFPSPAEQEVEHISLHELLIDAPNATHFVRASGHSMIGASINDGDLLIVDRSKTARNGSIVLATLDGDCVCKRLVINTGGTFLWPENDSFAPIKIEDGMDFEIFGVCTNVIHSLKDK